MNRARDIAHDVRNPLNVAIEHLRLLKATLPPECVEDEAVQEHLEAVEAAHGRIEEIAAETLDGGTDGRAASSATSVDLASVARDAWQFVETGDLALEIAGSRALVGDRSTLQRLFENLYRNVVEHAAEATTVTVGATPDGFYLADDGTGIPPEQRTAVLEAGYSTSESNTGLGLAIAQRAVAEYGWSIEIGDAEGGGAKVVVATGAG